MEPTEWRKRWTRTVGALALTAGLSVSAAAPAFAQQGGQGGAIDLSGAPVALHDGNCANPIVEPEFELGQLEPEPYTEVYDDFVRDALDDDVPADVQVPGVAPRLIDEDLDDDGVLDEEEDIDGDGVLDVGIDEDADGVFDDDEAVDGDLDDDGVADVDEETYLDEDLNDDGVLDPDEDLDDDGVIDAGFDEDGDGVLDENEIAPAAGMDVDAALVLIDLPTVWKVEEEVDATFEELFGEEEAVEDEEEDDDALDDTGLIAVHESSENFGNIVACGELTAPLWEDESDVVVGIRPVNQSGVYGFAVFERDTGNVPVFGENTTGVTVYLFQNLRTLRQERMGTPAAAAPTPTPTPPTPTPTPAAFDLPTEVAIELGNDEFNPSEFRIAADTDVEVTLSNLSTTPATFTIDELGIDERLEPDETRAITINAPAGRYEYYSAAGGDREAGMVGTLIVGQ